MLANRYDEFVFQTEYRGRYGSGVCCQTEVQGKVCLITAAHCILGDNLEDEIDFSQIQFSRQRNGKKEKFDVQICDVFFSIEKDICVFVSVVQYDMEYPILGAVQREEPVFVCGFPRVLADKKCRYERYKLRGVVNEFPEQGVMQLQMSSNLETSEMQAKDMVGGMSGSGIFVERGHQIYLVGIVTDLSSQDGAFNSLLGTMIEILWELLSGHKYFTKTAKSANEFRIRQEVRNGFYHYELSDTIISTVKEADLESDTTRYSHEQFMEWFLQSDVSCIQILGEGGSGKTSFLIKSASYLKYQLKIDVYYIWLNDLEESLEEYGQSNSPIVLLLDGFNELQENKKREMALQIKTMCKNPYIKIVLASRRKIDGAAGLYGVKAFYMEKLRDEQIENYLREQMTDLEQAKIFWELLRNPMMLTVYTQTSIELKNNKELAYFRFYDTCCNRGELILNYLESLTAKQYMQYAGQEWSMNELVVELYIMHFILPEIAEHMERERRFVLNSDGLYFLIEEKLKLQQDEWGFIKRWYEKREIIEIETLKQLDVVKVISYLRNFPSVFCREKDWRYTHHNFRDGLAAMSCMLKCEKGVWEQKIPQCLYQPLSEEIIEFVAELSESITHMTRSDILDELLDMLRGKESEIIRLPLYHILQIKKKRNGNLAGVDFTNLDLKGQILEPYIDGKHGTIKTDFSGAIIYPENLIPIGHASRVTQVCYSPDGKRILTASDDGTVWMWNAHTGQPEKKIETGESSFCSGLEVSGDNTLLAMSTFGAVFVWNVESGELLYSIHEYEDIVEQIAFHPSGMELASADQSGDIRIWDMKTGKENFRLSCCGKREYFYQNAVKICYSLDGRYIAAGYEDGYARIWSTESGQCLGEYAVYNKGIRDIKYSPDGKYLVIASEDNVAVVLNAENGEKIFSLEGHTHFIFRTEFSPDGKFLSTASADETARIWDIKTGKCVRILDLHEEYVQIARFHPSGKYLATAGCDGLVVIWDVDSGQPIHKLARHQDIVGTIAFSPDGESLVTASLDENIYVWNVASGKVKHILKNNGKRINHFQMTPHGEVMTIDYPEQTARIWDTVSRRCLWEKKHVSYDFSFHPQGRWYVERESREEVQVVDIKSRQEMWKFRTEKNIKRVVCSSQGTYMAVLFESGEVDLILAETGQRLATLAVKCSGMEFSPNEIFLLLNGGQRIWIWNCVEGVWWSEYRKSTEGFANTDFSSDSRYIVMREWRTSTHFIDLFAAEDGIVRAKMSNRDEKYQRDRTIFFATINQENVLKTWNYETGDVNRQIELISGEIGKMVCHENGKTAAVLYKNGKVVVVNLVKGMILKELEAPGSAVWEMEFGLTPDTLLLVDGAILYYLNWQTEQYGIVVDQRYEERLKGCKLEHVQFSDEMRKEDIALLQQYS